MGTPKTDNNLPNPSKPNSKPYGKIVLTLKNCLLPEEKLKPTPSETDGLDPETEIDLRILGCELIQTAGILLKLPQVAMATGQVLFQRFYYSKSLVRHSMEATAMGCVCLASKIEEAPRRIRDVVNVFHHIKQVTQQRTIQPMILDQAYIALKTQVIKAERRVLKELGFCVHVKHPHKIIVMYLQVLGYEKHKALMQSSWNYMNDSLRTNVFVRYDPETVACACIYLASRSLGICLPKQPAWFDIFNVTESSIKDVCYTILRLYKRTKPNAEELDKKIEELRQHYQEARQKIRSQNNPTSGANTPPSSNQATSPTATTGSGKSSAPTSTNNNSTTAATEAQIREKSWSGFISRATDTTSAFHSSPTATRHSKTKEKKSIRSRSRSHERKSKKSHKSRRSYSRSPSISPSHKNSRKHSRDKVRYRSRSRSYEGRSYDRYSDSKYYEKTSKSSTRVKHEIRSKDRR